jgi:branched-chain amino acid aminotransferase
MKSEYIWMNGNLIPFDQANVHFLSPTIHYGYGVFEGARCYETSNGPAIFRLKEHMKRFIDSALIIGFLDFPYTLEELKEAVHQTIRANKFRECYIRPAIYVDGPLGLNADDYQINVGIAVWKWGAYLGEDALEKGVRMTVSSFTRMHHNSFMTKAKAAGNYINSIIAKTLAHRDGYDEAIMIDPDGYVAECSGMNIFIIRDEVIYTPPRATILEGITRDSVLTIAEDLGYKIVEEPMVRDQLYIADEVFVSGTAAEITAVCEIDTRKIGIGSMGPVTRRLQKAFFDTVRGSGTHSAEWLDYVDMSPNV